MGEIFVFCCEEGTTIEVMAGTSHEGEMPMPVVLSSVSKRWRRVAISTRDLWSSLHLDISEPFWRADLEKNEEEAERCFRIVEMYLRRARDAPLSLCFTEDATSLRIDGALDALCRVAHQWHTVTFETSESFLQHDALESIRGRLINLRDVSFSVPGKDEQGMADFLDLCPALRRLHHKVQRTWPPVSRDPPQHALWKQLETLSLSPDEPEMHLKMVRIASWCTGLVHLHIKIAFNDDRLDLQGQVACVSNLQSLCLEVQGGLRDPVFTAFLPYITTPQLKSLGLRGDAEFFE
ncbi:hypothetical protein V5O48_019092, partial [Marasmius crinis-equi]